MYLGITFERIVSRKEMPAEIWHLMVRYGLSEPCVLRTAKVSEPFVYDREIGFFYVPKTKHQSAMSLLLAWRLGYKDPFEVPGEKYQQKSIFDHDFSEMADYYLENFSGTCFKSSVSDYVLAGKKGHLNSLELDVFGSVSYLCKS